LPADEALTLVCRRLGVTGLPAPVAALIREKAEGNPFFSEELAYALRDSGLIQMSGSECRLAAGVDLKAVAFPDTVQGVITSRIDRLPPPQQLALKVASVIGRIFAFRILRDIYPIEDDRLFLKDYLQTLEQLDLTPLDAPEPDLAYVFKHIITQEVAYNLMLFAQRRDLHRAAAEWFERSYPDDLSPYYPLLAYHWSKAEDHEKTVEYLEKAGEQAIQSGAYQEAIGFFSEVLKAAADDSRHPLPVTRRAHWERLLGEAQYSLGNLAESRRHLERALAWLGRPIPETRGGLVLSLLAEVGRTAFRVLWPNRSTGRVEAVRPDLLEAYRACEAVISPYVLTNEAPRLILAGLRFGNLADMIGPSPEMARGFAGAGFFFGLVPLHGLAQAQQARGLQIAESQNDLPALARVLFFVGLYNYGLGEWAKSREALSRAREINGRLGARRQWDESSGILAQAIFAQGEFETSAQIEAQIDASARQRGDMQAHLYQLIAQSEVVLRLGRPGHADEAVALMEEATTVPAQGLDQSGQMRAYAILALARLRRGEAHLAREAADRALAAILNTPPTSCWTLEGYAGAAETYLSLIETRANRSPAERRALAKFARQAIGALRQFARVFPIGQPRAWLFQGFYDWLDGKPAKARQAWRKGLAAAQKLAMPYDEALAHFEIGRHASGDERRDHLDRAADIFERLGAEYDLQRAQAEIKTP
jgi:tetratricopeptide (TPR) repeat protein